MKLQILLMGANIAHNVITNLLISFALCTRMLPSVATPQVPRLAGTKHADICNARPAKHLSIKKEIYETENSRHRNFGIVNFCNRLLNHHG